MNRLQSLVLASVALVGLGLVANAGTTTTTTTTTVTTTTSDGSATEARAAKKGHCIASLTEAKEPVCYATYTEVVAATSGGKITNAPADVRVAMRDKELLKKLHVSSDKKNMEGIPAEERNAAQVQVLTIYCDDGFTGCTFGNDSLTYIGPVCNDDLNDTEKPITYVGDAWNDDFESFIGFNNCWAKVFEHIDFGGASTPFAPDLNSLGVLNDEGSSIRVS